MCLKSVFLIGLALLTCLMSALALDTDDFTFRLDGMVYTPGDDPILLIEALTSLYGEPEVIEADSCLFSGKDREYDFGAVVVATCPSGQSGGDEIETIMVFGAAYPTDRGIRTGMKGSEVLTVYGNDCTVDFDRYTYHINGADTDAMLVFIIDMATDTVVCYYMYRNSV